MDQFRRDSDNSTPPPIIFMRESAFSRPILPPSSSLLPPKPFTGALGSGSAPPPDPVATPEPPSSDGGGKYRECLRNHADTLSGNVVDGCGEFISAGPTTPIKCAACGCHRSFHRREPPDDHNSNKLPSCHRLLRPPPPKTKESSSSEEIVDLVRKKRFRTKFSSEQKGKMMSFAERVEWRVQKKDEAEMESFCREIGVTRKVLKVWLNNHKHLKKNINQHPLPLE